MTNYRLFSSERIFKARKLIEENFGANVSEFMDHYPLFARPQTMLRYQVIQSLLERVLSIPGDICEFGTWKGSTAVYLAKMLDELEPQSNRKIIVFDNFTGLPAPSEKDSSKAEKEIGNYKGDLDSLITIINTFDLSHRIEIIKGDANEFVPDYFSKNNHLLISLVYFDFDWYDPTINAWNAIKNNISNGGLIAFDEGLDKERFVGEYKAAKEIIDELRNNNRNFSIESNRKSRQPQLIISLD